MATRWHEKVVAITGASNGLGRHIARAFGKQGAHVVLAARTPETLEAAAAELRGEGASVLAVPCDVTQQTDVDAFFARTIERFGRLDVLVNNAGRSMRRAVIETSAEDFEQLMELNLVAVVRCTRAAMPHLLANRGHLVNIGSLSGKTASRYMGAYPATKFALTAYTQQLRLELSSQGLHVLLVSPGPIARDEPRTASERDARGDDAPGLPSRAYKPGAGVRLPSIRPEKLANLIVRACETRKAELTRPWSARWLFALMQISPRLADWIVRRTT